MSSQSSDEIDLRYYGQILWRRKFVIAALTLLVGGATYWIASREPRVYLAATKVVVPGATNQNHLIDQYKGLLTNSDLATRVMKEFGLDRPPYNYSLRAFFGSVFSVQEMAPFSSIALIQVLLPDRVMAANVANRYQALAAELIAKMGLNQNEASLAIVKDQLEQARARLAVADAALQKYRRSAQMELVQKDVATLLDQRGRLIVLTVDLESDRARLAEAERQLAKQPPTVSSPTAIDLSDALSRAGGAGAKLRPETISPYLNPLYEILSQQVALSRTRVAALEKEQSHLATVLKLGGADLAQLTQLYAKENELGRLQAEADLARKISNDLASQYEQSRARLTSPPLLVHVVDPAIPPTEPNNPGPLRRGQLGLIAGFLGSIALVLVVDFATKRRRAA